MVTEVHNENLGVILVDKGMVEDHLPNRVLGALVQCRATLLKHYNPARIKKMREDNEDIYRQIYRARNSDEQGFPFLVKTPSVDEARLLQQENTGGDSTPETVTEAEVSDHHSLNLQVEHKRPEQLRLLPLQTTIANRARTKHSETLI